MLGQGAHIPPLSREKLAELDALHRKLVTPNLTHLLSLPAGAELDYAVVHHVMGWPLKQGGRMTLDYASKPVPPFSTDISAAWTVVERIAADFPDGICIERERSGWDVQVFDGPRRNVLGEGETAPLAICRCALRTKLSIPQPEGVT